MNLINPQFAPEIEMSCLNLLVRLTLDDLKLIDLCFLSLVLPVSLLARN